MNQTSRRILSRMMSIVFLCSIFLMCMPTAQAASAPALQLCKTYGGSEWDLAVSARQNADKTYTFAAVSTSSDKDFSLNKGQVDAWMVKLKVDGTFKWKKNYGGSAMDQVNAMQATKDGGYILAGFTMSNDGNLSGFHGVYDAWVLKLTSSGSVAWSKTLGGSGSDVAKSIVQTKDGGYIFCGFTNSTNGDVAGCDGKENMWIVKLSAGGATQWQRCIGTGVNTEAYCILESVAGGYVVAGSTLDDDYYYKDGVVAKLRSSGSVQWQKTMAGNGADWINSVVQAYDGCYVFAGSSSSNKDAFWGNHGGMDLWAFKLSASGTLKWNKLYGGSAADFGNAIDRTLDGGYILAGTVKSNNGNISHNKGQQDIWLCKISATGTPQWKQCYGTSENERVSSVKQTELGGYLVAGGSAGKGGAITQNRGNMDALIIKLGTDLLYKKPVLSEFVAARTSTTGAVLKIRAELSTTAVAKLQATIYNSAKKSVAVLTLKDQFSGTKRILWDGKATSGNTAGLSAGTLVPIASGGSVFTVKLSATNVKGTVSASTTVRLYRG